MPQPVPYLSFNGNCTEAMRFYEKTFGGKLEALMSHGDIPGWSAPPEIKDRIMHAYLKMPGGGELMAGDSQSPTSYEPMKGVMLAITFPTVEEATRVFNELAAGGNITMPLAPSFWAKTFGMVVDKFGISWGINGGQVPRQEYLPT